MHCAHRLATVLLYSFILALTPGCFVTRQSVNEPLEAESLAGLQPGTTTALEAVELLGGPVEVIQLGYRSAYLYRHVVTKRAGLFLIVFGAMNEETDSDRSWLFFDENDVLTHVGTTLAAGAPDYKMPWQVRREEGQAAREAELERQREENAAGTSE
jgi:hypothetical protein